LLGNSKKKSCFSHFITLAHTRVQGFFRVSFLLISKRDEVWLPLSMRVTVLSILALSFFFLSRTSSFAQFNIDGYHLVDFGNPSSTLPVNTISSTAASTRKEIPATNGCNNYLEVVIVDDFAGVNNSGTQQADPSLGLPASLTGDSFFGHTGDFNGGTNPTAAIEIRGIPAGESVDFGLFASRIGAGNRQTCYTFFGQDTLEVCFDPNNNTNQLVEATISSPIEIDSTNHGLVRIEMTAGPDNDTPEGFFYLGGLTIQHEFSRVTLEAQHSFDPLFLSCSPVYEVGDQVIITADAYNPCNTDMGLFVDGELVDTVFNAYPNFGFDFTVPNQVVILGSR